MLALKIYMQRCTSIVANESVAAHGTSKTRRNMQNLVAIL